MRQFFKIVFGSALGFFIANLFLLFTAIMLFTIIAISSNKDFKLQDNSVFRLRLEGEIIDRSQQNPFADLLKDFKE